MNGGQVTYPVKDRLSYYWLVIGLLLLIPYRVPLVSWLAPIFMLRFIRTQKTGRGLLIFFLSALLLVCIIVYPYLGPLGMTSIPLIFILVAFTAIIVVLPLLADRLLVPRLSGFLATLIFPLASTVVDFVNFRSSASGSFMDSAYFQYGDFALMQIVSITGIWGIIFLINWFSAVVNYAWERGFSWSEIRRGMVIYSAIMAAVMIYGSVRLAYAPEASRTVRIHGFSALADFRYTEIPTVQCVEEQRLAGLSSALQRTARPVPGRNTARSEGWRADCPLA